MRVSVEWLGHHSYSCYFAGGIRYVGKGGDCAHPLLTLAVAGEASFHCGCSLPLPSVIVLTIVLTLRQRNTKVSPDISLWLWKSVPAWSSPLEEELSHGHCVCGSGCLGISLT